MRPSRLDLESLLKHRFGSQMCLNNLKRVHKSDWINFKKLFKTPKARLAGARLECFIPIRFWICEIQREILNPPLFSLHPHFSEFLSLSLYPYANDMKVQMNKRI